VNEASTQTMSVKDWFITILILAIPLVNIVMYLYWAFAEGVNLNKRNFCRASLLWVVIGVGLAIVFALLGGMAAMMSGSGG